MKRTSLATKEYGANKTTINDRMTFLDLTEKEIIAIRNNWNKLGCEYWYTDNCVEYWKTPDGHVIDFCAEAVD